MKLAIQYQVFKKICFVDKSKSDAVKIYLTNQIEQARIGDKAKDVKELEKELSIV